MTVKQVLWAAALRNKGLDDRLAAVAKAGFSHMSAFPVDVKNWRKAGDNDRQIATKCRDAGVAIVTIDPYVQWTPGFRLEDYPSPDDRAFVEHDEAAVFAMAEAFGAPQINLVSWGNAALDIAAAAESLAAVADRAKARGIKLTFEFMPLSNVPDLKTAIQLLDAVGGDRVGLTFDTWHFHRSDPDHALLRTLDGARVTEIQLADAAMTMHGDLMNDLQHFRRVPGEGEFDLTTTVTVLKEIGAWRSVGPEIFSDEMDGLTADDAAARARAGQDRFN